MSAPAITLLTDFGTADGYVAEMKGVLCTLAPTVPVIDLSHDISPQDVTGARLALARCWRRFPQGTVHVVVVDPGVGSARAAIAVESEGRMLVGPDNGVLSPSLFALDARVVQLPVPTQTSATFHGRDIFAPVAARLACGASLDEVGEPYTRAIRLRTPQPQRQSDGALHGEVLTVDRFGNAITNLMLAPHAQDGMVTLGMQSLRLVRTYSDAAPGELVALVGSSGWIEIAMRNGNAAAELRISRGMPVRIEQAL